MKPINTNSATIVSVIKAGSDNVLKYGNCTFCVGLKVCRLG